MSRLFVLNFILGVTVHDSLVPKPYADGHGLFVNAKIPENLTTLLSVPEKVVLSLKRVLKLHPEWKDLSRQLKLDYSLLAAFIARVRSGVDTFEKDKKAVFDRAEYLYIRYLPDKCLNGWTISQKALEVLPKKPKDLINSERVSSQGDFNTLSRHFSKSDKNGLGFNLNAFSQVLHFLDN